MDVWTDLSTLGRKIIFLNKLLYVFQIQLDR